MEGILLPLPWTVRRSFIRVPYVANPSHQLDGFPFEDFARHQGFSSIDSALELLNTFESNRDLVSFFQSWLFFGLLSAFLRDNVDQSSLVVDGYVECHQEYLHWLFQRWQARLAAMHYSKQQLARAKFETLLVKAAEKCDVFEEAADYLGLEDEDFDRVALSVRILVNALSVVVEDTFDTVCPPTSNPFTPSAKRLASRIRISSPFASVMKSLFSAAYKNFTRTSLFLMSKQDAKNHLHRSSRFSPLPPGVTKGSRAANRLHKIFVENGWCPYRALQLCRSYDYVILNCFASLVRSVGSSEDHGRCLQTESCCSHNLIVNRPSQYPFAHDSNCHRDCDFVHVPREKVVDIIRSGAIPIISVSLEGDLDLQVTKSSPWLTYTAISHVWSDGMGNPESNSLPRCQLLRLRRLISETYSAEYSPFYDGSFSSTTTWAFWLESRQRNPYHRIDKKRVYFWMDTLCIPISPQSQDSDEDRNLRFRSMKNITPIFAGAYTTLVLDGGLQNLHVTDGSKIQGDEFAAIIVSSNWMQRGWTLEEGSLSSSCVFQMMGKSYEMNGSLHNLLPKLEDMHSPLARASLKIRFELPSFLRRGLADDVKSLAHDPRSWRAARYVKILRMSQFVWTWNSLLERSTTKPHDGPIILANLLDFNVVALKSIPHHERLRVLIDSCNEIPFSLLYNANPVVSSEERGEAAWIPRTISGSSLTSGVALRKSFISEISPQRAHFSVDLSNSDPDSFIVLGISADNLPEQIRIFKISLQMKRTSNAKKELVIELDLPQEDQGHSPDHRNIQEGNETRSSKEICLVLDLAVGSPSRRGFCGKGAIFSIESTYHNGMILRYYRSLTIWTYEQWQYSKESDLLPSLPLVHSKRIDRGHRLVLKDDGSLQKHPRLFRRPNMTRSPLYAVIPAALIMFIVLFIIVYALGYAYVTIREKLGFRPGPSPHSAIIILIFGPILALFVFGPIRERIAVFGYIKWLKSFDQGDEGSVPARNDNNKNRGTLSRIFRLMKEMKQIGANAILRRSRSNMLHSHTSGVTQVSIRLPSRRRHQDVEGLQEHPDEEDDVSFLSDEFPEEVFLE